LRTARLLIPDDFFFAAGLGFEPFLRFAIAVSLIFDYLSVTREIRGTIASRLASADQQALAGLGLVADQAGFGHLGSGHLSDGAGLSLRWPHGFSLATGALCLMQMKVRSESVLTVAMIGILADEQHPDLCGATPTSMSSFERRTGDDNGLLS